MKLKIKRHVNDLQYRNVEIKDGGYIHRYDNKLIRSAGYMERMLIKSLG